MAPGPKTDAHFPENTIIETRTGQPVTEQALMADLGSVGVVYAGEQHTDAGHHRVQLQILKALWERRPGLVVGMEMFDRTYQPVLDRWSKGELSMEAFLRLTHWQANWKFPISLYQEILEFIRDHRIRVLALNIPFYLPPRIAVGGVDSLGVEDRRWLPSRIDTQNPDHRAYVKTIFDFHPVPVRENFEFFYEAQCTWEDAMAETLVQYPTKGAMVLVLLGNGHIFRHFGVPDRAFSRSAIPFRTVYPVTGRIPSEKVADYIWISGGEPPQP